MRIDPNGFSSLGVVPEGKKVSDVKSSFVDTLKEVINTTNDRIKDSDKASLELASGKSGNIHESMIAMQKADLSVRLLVSVTNKLVQGYNELTRLR